MIEVKTILKPESVRKFNLEQAKRKIWISCVLTLLMIALGVVYLVLDINENLFYGIFLIVLGLLLPVLYLFIVKMLVDRTIKSSPLLQNETTQIWRFLEEKIILNESGKYVEANDTAILYDAVFKVEETASAFYLFLSKAQAYIIDAKGFTMGSRLELHDLLLNRLGGKRFKYSKRIYSGK